MDDKAEIKGQGYMSLYYQATMVVFGDEMIPPPWHQIQMEMVLNNPITKGCVRSFHRFIVDGERGKLLDPYECFIGEIIPIAKLKKENPNQYHKIVFDCDPDVEYQNCVVKLNTGGYFWPEDPVKVFDTNLNMLNRMESHYNEHKIRELIRCEHEMIVANKALFDAEGIKALQHIKARAAFDVKHQN